MSEISGAEEYKPKITEADVARETKGRQIALDYIDRYTERTHREAYGKETELLLEKYEEFFRKYGTVTHPLFRDDLVKSVLDQQYLRDESLKEARAIGLNISERSFKDRLRALVPSEIDITGAIENLQIEIASDSQDADSQDAKARKQKELNLLVRVRDVLQSN